MAKITKYRDRVEMDISVLDELAAQVNFKITCDEDYLTLFRVASDMGWWPELETPKTDTKGIHIPAEGPHRLNHYSYTTLGGLDSGVSPYMTKKGLQFDYSNNSQKSKREAQKAEKEQLRQELESIEAQIKEKEAQLAKLGLEAQENNTPEDDEN